MSNFMEYVLNCKKKLEKGCNDEKTMAILRQLKKVPMNVEILQKTGIGKLVRNMKNNGGEIGAMAQNIYDTWRKAVIDLSHHKNKECTNTQSDIYKVKSKENHKDFHNAKKVPSVEHTETIHKHQSRSKTDLKYKHKISDPHKKQISECNSYNYHTSAANDTRNTDSESEDEIAPTNHSVQKKTVNYGESGIRSASHKDKEETTRKHKSSNTNYDKSHKQLKESHKGELSSEPKSSKQESRTKSKKTKLLKANKESFNSSNATFEDILGLNDTVSPKKKKVHQNSQLSVRNVSHDSPKRESIKKPSTKAKKQADKVCESTDEDDEEESVSLGYPDALKKPRLLPLEEVDILSTLPAIQPNYKPLPHKDIDSLSKKKKTTMSNEEAIMFTTSRRDRTAVYAGRRNIDGIQDVRSLYDQCIRVLIENVDALAYTGGVPYLLLKPVLQICNAVQLYTLEGYNPDLLEDTDELWKIHCEREFKRYTPAEHETWRELYLRRYDERETKLRTLTANISASMAKTSNIRQTKLAYVDGTAKPPRDVARRQAKHGTGLPSAMPLKISAPSKATPRPTAPVINASSSSSAPLLPPVQPKKPRVAPLMQKTLKLMKQHFRR